MIDRHELFQRDDMPDHVLESNREAMELIGNAIQPIINKIPPEIMVTSFASTFVALLGLLVVAKEKSLKDSALAACKGILTDMERLIEHLRKEGKLIESERR